MKSAYQYLIEILYLVGESRSKLPALILLFLFSSILDLLGLGLIAPYVSLIMNFENQNIDFFLEAHSETKSPEHLTRISTEILDILDSNVKRNKISDGDLIQALALVTAIRIYCSGFDPDKLRKFSDDLIKKTVSNIKSGKFTKIGSA